MADPLSLTASIIAITQTVSQIYTLAKTIKDAKLEIKRLCDELFALKGVLELVKIQFTASSQELFKNADGCVSEDLPHAFGSQEFEDVLECTQKFVDDILKSLPETKGLKSALQRLSWPFSKSEIKEHISRLERVKSWFMFAMLNDTLGYTTESYNAVCKLTKEFKLDKEKRDQDKQEKIADKIVEWLAPADPRPTHLKACEVHQTGTGLWFIHGYFKQWHEGPSNTLLCLSGRSGSGKTVMMSSAVEQVNELASQDASIGLAYFYCAYNNAASQEPANILGSILVSLSRSKPELLLGFKSKFEKAKQNNSRDRPQLDDLEKHLGRCFESFSKVFLFIDALNESKYCKAVIGSLARFCQSANNVYVMLSRIDEVIDEDLEEFPAVVMVRMGEGIVTTDIKAFVEACLQNIPTLHRLKSELKNEIRTTLITRSQGMFRWVRCQVDWLSIQRTANAVRAALRKLPETMEDTYNAMLSRIPGIDKAIAREALLWLSYTTIPLTLEELCEIVALGDNPKDLDDGDRLQNQFLIPDTCQGLIIYNTSNHFVTLAHFSVKEFLTSPRRKEDNAFYYIEPYASHTRIASQCLTYLCFPAFRTMPRTNRELENRHREWPLLYYATWSWGAHANALGENMGQDLQQKVRDFFSTSSLPQGGHYAAWVKARYPATYTINHLQTQPLYYACSLGIAPVVRVMLKADPAPDINLCGGRAHSPIVQTAAYYGHYETTKLLLEAGADPNVENCLGQTALRWVESLGYDDIAELLLRYGALSRPPSSASSLATKGSTISNSSHAALNA